jgi:hypothetical protein
MRSPRAPVMLVKAMASLNPVSLFSNFVFAFWSPVRVTAHNR